MSTGSLPPELLELTFGFCRDLRRLHAAACVCKSWLKAAARCRDALRRLTFARGYGERGSRHYQFHHADAICAMGCDMLLVAEEQRLRLVTEAPELSHEYMPMKEWGHPLLPLHHMRGSDGPSGMAFDGSSRVYISDSGSDVVVALQLGRTPIPTRCETTASISTVICGPGALCLHQGRLYVACTPRNIVVIADLPRLTLPNPLHHKCPCVWGGPGEDAFGGQPQDLAALDDELFVADTQNHRIVVLDCATGNRLRTLGKQGTAPGEFRKPTAITACRRGADAFLIVGEFTGRRVQILSLHGAPLQLLTLAPAVRVGPFCVQGDRVYATASAPGPPLLVFDLKK